MTTARLLTPAPAARRTTPRPLGTARWRRVDALAGFGWISTAVAVALYLADAGLSQFATIGGAMTALGIIAGLISTNALLLMLLLSARVPAIDNTIGQVKANQWHRALGEILVFGLVGHAAFLLAGAAYTARMSIIAAFAGWWTMGDFVLAVIALGLIVLVTVTSIASARAKTRYEVWYAIHLMSYVAVGLSIPHMFSMGGLFAVGTWQRVYWTTALLAVGVALVAYRVGVPLYRTLRHNLRLVHVARVSADTFNLTFSGRHLDSLDARPGQYLNWRFLTPGLWTQSHPMSLSAAPDGRTLRITVRVVGDGTARMVAAPLGTRVVIEGPYGVFTDAARTRDALVLVGAGTGIAPIRALVDASTAPAHRTTVILRASTPDDVLLADEFHQACRRRGINLFVLVGPRAGNSWVPVPYAGYSLASFAPYVADADVFACGPDAFTDLVLADAARAGVSEDQLHEERFNW